MPANDAPIAPPAPAISWRLQSNAASLAFYSAVLDTPACPVFATLAQCHEPAGMWLLTMFPQVRRRQFTVFFDGRHKAMRAVELWARHHGASIEDAHR